MEIRKLKTSEFEDFALKSPLKNYMQTKNYAKVMETQHFSYDFLGLIDDNGSLVAASLILIKKLNFNNFYGYAPKGFLVNYYSKRLVKEFITLLKKFYAKKNVTFIKINPEIVVATVDIKTRERVETENAKLKLEFNELGFSKLKDNLYFESVEPRFNAYIDLKKISLKNYSKANRNKVRNARRKGLYMTMGTEEDIEEFYKLIKTDKNISYYKNLYKIFSETSSIELHLVKVDYEAYIKKTQKLYERELNNNNLLNEILHRRHKLNDLNKKMASDTLLSSIKNEIILATEGLRDNNNLLVAGAIVVKFANRVHIIASGYDTSNKALNANYFLYDKLIEEYKNDYEFLDLNGVTGDAKKNNPYHGLDRFKFGFNPQIYEYIGEYDLILNKMNYNYLLTTGKLAHEFNKKKK